MLGKTDIMNLNLSSKTYKNHSDLRAVTIISLGEDKLKITFLTRLKQQRNES